MILLSKKIDRLVLAISALVFGAAGNAVAQIAAETTFKDGGDPRLLVSDVYHINRLYASMEGPVWRQGDVLPGRNLPTGRYWITGVKVRVVGQDRASEESSEWFCHANLTLPGDNTPVSTFGNGVETPTEVHRRLNPDNGDLDHRLFTLVPGREEIQLPEGFGIPMQTSEPLEFLSMALNLNAPRPDKHIRFATEISTSVDPSLKPVFRRALYNHVTSTPETAPRPEAMCVSPAAAAKDGYGAFCGPDMRDLKPNWVVGEYGKTQIMHWIVAPGRHLFTNDVTANLNISKDTAIHYATGHLHPYGAKLTLLEKKAGGAETPVLSVAVRNCDGRLGVREVSEVRSREGIPVSKSSQYKLVAEYDNTTGRNIDAMGILYLYLSE
jgi:hypothetical protein